MLTSTSLYLRTESMTILGGLRRTEAFSVYVDTLAALNQSPEAFCRNYARLCQFHYTHGDLGKLLAREIHYDTNVLTQSVNQPISSDVRAAADFDLYTVNALISLSGSDFLDFARRSYRNCVDLFDALPGFSAGTPLPFGNCDGLLQMYRKKGSGYFARANAFTVLDGVPQPIANPDPIRLSDLKGYAVQKKAIRDNTLSLLAGKNANNILLYGDKGCGKSSTVKAIANEYADRGLKIIELPMDQIKQFPAICSMIERSPFTFILFLDDLSFTAEDERFVALKAFIEGGVAGKPHNMAIYATSNRRHIVREKFSDRAGDDVHVRDALQSASSLSDRFGIEITFSNPVKNEYLYIVDRLAEDYGLELPEERLHLLAERFAIRKNGRSPRTARQFITHQLALEHGETVPDDEGE
ncbi:MAG TPA: ATP-binding protein [Candidatus Butyricicoccus stercorigallinarum]|nr:ATP-binding protein [Candidatus Butyricicoccus stercorigallinarum]